MAAAMNFICELYLNKALIFRKLKKKNQSHKDLHISSQEFLKFFTFRLLIHLS